MCWVKPVKLVSFITIIVGMAVLGASIWTLITIPGLLQLEDTAENDNTTDRIEKENLGFQNTSEAEMSENVKNIARCCIAAAGCGALLQILLSIIVCCANDTNLNSRLEAWEAMTLVSFLVNATSSLIPFTFDLESDAFLGIKTFGYHVINGGDPEWLTFLMSTSTSSSGGKGSGDERIRMYSYLWTKFTYITVALSINVIVTLTFLLLIGSCLCCCRSEPDKRIRQDDTGRDDAGEGIGAAAETTWAGSGGNGSTSSAPSPAQLPGLPDLLFG